MNLRKKMMMPLVMSLAAVLTSYSSLAEEKKVKVVEFHSAIEVAENGNETPFKFVFEGKPDEQAIEDAIAELSPEKQEKIRNILNNLHLDFSEEMDGERVFAFKFDDNSDGHKIELHRVKEWADTVKNNMVFVGDNDKSAKVYKFMFGDNGTKSQFDVIKKLVESSELTAEQISELQDIINSK